MSLHPEGQAPSPHGLPQINWLPWDTPAFARAQEEDKPVLLSIDAVWCYWCHVMDGETYTDPDVVSFVNQYFVPVRVDNDHRPDINARYNVGGWPSTIFLTPHGGFIAGATYLPPDQLLAMLMEVHRAYGEQKVSLYDQGNSILRQRREEAAKVSASIEADSRLVDHISRRAAGTYDARFGGFGEEPKFPCIPVLQLLLHLFRATREEFYRVMLEKTLDAMAQGEIFDGEEGGFFRYTARADWSEAQHEKMLEDNIGLARVFLDASLLLDNQDYRRTASRTIDYLLASLYDEKAGGFRGSQGAHSDYFGLPTIERRQRAAPAVDPHCYAGWSAQAVSLLLEGAWKLQRSDLTPQALRVLQTLDSMQQSGHLTHVYNGGGPLPGSTGRLLADRAHLLNALMDAHAWLPEGNGFLDRARSVAQEILDRYFDYAKGGFFDVERDSDAVGYLQVREKPLPENVAALHGLLKLHQATADDAYKDAVRLTLSAFVEVNLAYGEFAAGYAIAVDQFLNRPIEVTVEGHPQNPATQAMLRALANVPYRHIIVKTVGADVGSEVLAHICVGTVCIPPIRTPEELAAGVHEAMAPQESPFENVFGSFV